MMLNRVDLPQPDGPITPRNSPGATDSETPSTAVTTPSGVSNRLVMLSTVRIAAAGAAARSVGIAMTAMASRVPGPFQAHGPIAHRPSLPHGGLRAKVSLRLLAPPGTARTPLAGEGSLRRVSELIWVRGTPPPGRVSGHAALPSPASGAGNPRRCARGHVAQRTDRGLRQLGLERPAGPATPVLPRPVDRVGPGPLDHLVDFPGVEELNVANGHRLHLQLGVDLEIDRDEHG